MLYSGDEKQHNNPDLAYVDASFIRGGGKVTANLSTLLTDFANKTDQLKENVTTVFVTSEGLVYRLKSIANIGTLVNGWKKETVDLSQGAKIGAINTLTGLPAFEFAEGGDTNSELVFGTATTTGQVLKVIGFRAGGERGQNGAPAGRFPLRMELNFGVRWCLPGVNANTGGKNHFGVYQADGVSEIIYVDNEGTVRMAIPAQDAGSSDYIAIIGTDGTLKKMSQTALRRPYRGTFTTIAALQTTPGLPGDYASIDLGTGADAMMYIYDASDNQWVPSTKKSASSFSELGGNPVDNPALAAALNLKANASDVALKCDKLESFYTTQTASFIIAADMVDKTISCNHATVTIVATISDDSMFTIGARFEVRQSGVAGVSLASAAGITLNAPQGLALNRRYSYMQVVKQAANVYSVTIIGDDPTKVDKVNGKDLSDQNYTLTEKSKLGNLLPGTLYGFTFPKTKTPEDYYETASTISKIRTRGVSTLKYSTNGGTTYLNIPLTITGVNGVATPNISLQADTWIIFLITYQASTTAASIHVKI